MASNTGRRPRPSWSGARSDLGRRHPVLGEVGSLHHLAEVVDAPRPRRRDAPVVEVPAPAPGDPPRALRRLAPGGLEGLGPLGRGPPPPRALPTKPKSPG